MDNDNNVKQNNRPSRAGSANPFFFHTGTEKAVKPLCVQRHWRGRGNTRSGLIQINH